MKYKILNLYKYQQNNLFFTIIKTAKLKLDTENPMTLREDVAVQNKFSRDELLKNAPEVQAGCLVVPKTVE